MTTEQPTPAIDPALMAATILFRTPGAIDMRAFTTMGVNAKPNTPNPIGYFGTGLKYAVAVLCRLGAEFSVYTSGDRYVFETRKMKFRDAEFQQIVMRRDKWLGPEGWRVGRARRLPITTQYGRNWETWMAFRELYSNTLDEQGDTLELNEQQTGEWNEKHPNRWGMVETGKETLIAVTKCPEFVEAFRSRSAIFLSLDDHPVISKLGGVEIREGVTERLFYQGMRAKDVGKPAMFTYNFTVGQVLTEDRQLAHEHQVRTVLANNIAKADDEAVIEKIVTADQEQWEHGLEPSSWIEPSRAFHNVMIRVKSKATGAWGGYFRSHDDRPEVKKKDLWEDAPRPWKVDGGDILDNEGKPLFSMPFNMNNLVWATLAERLVRVSNSWKPPKSKGRAALAADFGLEPEYTLLYNPIATAEVLSEGEDDTPF